MKKLASLMALPSELLLQVMEYLLDLDSLYSLTTAHPHAALLFDSHGPKILEDVLRHYVKSKLNVEPHVHKQQGMNIHIAQSIRLIALVRSALVADSSRNLLLDSWARFRETYILSWAPSAFRDRYNWAPGPCLTTMAACPARDILALARQVSLLADECFDFFIDRWMQSKPQHLINKRISYLYKIGDVSDWFAGHRYEPRPGRPPTRAEMTLIQAGLWDLQLAFELKAAAARSDAARVLPWPGSDVEHIAEMQPWELLPLRGAEPARLGEAVASVLEFLRHKDPDILRQSRIPAPAGDRNTGWGREVDETVVGTQAGDGWAITKVLCTRPGTPLGKVPFEPFRRLGLGLWCRERLADFELYNITAEASRSPSGELPDLRLASADMTFTWWSLLTEDDVAAQQSQLKESTGESP